MISFNRFTLDNGLRVLHHYDDATQMVAVNLLFDVGSRDENPNRTGLAHLMEHLMFSGSKNAPSFDGPLQSAGGTNNAWTSVDMTNYYETLPAHNIETAFWLESDRLVNLQLTEESINTQKSVVIEEFKQRCLNQPYGDISHIVNGLCYKVHPYKWPTIGLRVEDIENASYDEIVGFFKSHYSVNNAILCVSGHIEFDKTVELTKKWFGDIQPVDILRRNLPIEPQQVEPRFLSHTCENVPQNLIYMLYHMCGRGDADFQATDMLSDVLSNGTSARFYRDILLKSNLFTELDASVTGTLDPGLFMIRGRLGEGVSFDEAKQVIINELDNFFENGATEYEIQKYANKYESNELFDSIGFAEKALKLCKYELLDSAEAANHEVEKYRSLTPEMVMTTAQNILRPENCSVLYYGPQA